MEINKTRGQLLKAIGLDAGIAGAEGNYLILESGRRVLDGNSQYGAIPFGHDPQFVADAIRRHLDSQAPRMVQPFDNPVTRQLAARLAALTAHSFEHATFACSGAEAVEAALKLVRCKSDRPRLLAAANGFHGKTRGALAVTVDPLYNQPFVPEGQVADTVRFGDAAALEQRLATGVYAALILEPVQGEGGIVPAPPGYLQAARELCSRHGTLLIVDEIQTGFFRSGPCFAYQASGIVPDILLVGKALGGGMVPISACLSRKSAWSETFCRKHSSTFANNGLAAAAALAVVEHVQAHGAALSAHVEAVSAQLLSGLRRLAAHYPSVIRDVRGQGLLIGVEFQPFSQSYFLQYLSNSGMQVPLICSYLFNAHDIHFAPTLKKNCVLRLEPPLTLTMAEVQAILDAIGAACALIERHGCTGLIDFVLNRMEMPNAA